MAYSDTDDIVSALLNGVVEQLDVPEDLLALADQVYDEIGIYLSSNLPDGLDWLFYPQGSARTGTGVRPADEWDIDAVAEVDIRKENIEKTALKDHVGRALAGYATSRSGAGKLAPTGLTTGRRCWTLGYKGRFHVDVLPAVPNPQGLESSIWIADRPGQKFENVPWATSLQEMVQVRVRVGGGTWYKTPRTPYSPDLDFCLAERGWPIRSAA
jgi:hypothetical protein